jgi:hypothetical protein
MGVPHIVQQAEGSLFYKREKRKSSDCGSGPDVDNWSSEAGGNIDEWN